MSIYQCIYPSITISIYLPMSVYLSINLSISLAGNFFTRYPRHRKLISINKRNTGKTNKEFNMRHDWNSLLSDNEALQMRHYSKVMFPPADVLVKYLTDFQRLHNINVQFDTEIKNIYTVDNDTVSEGHTFIMKDQNENSFTCR